MPINLTKNQSIDLTKSDGGSLRNIRLGLGWDAKVVTKKRFLGGTTSVQKAIDLDAGALLFGTDGRLLDTIYFGHDRSEDHAIVYPGDNRTGEGDGDDESIIVNLTNVSPSVHRIVLVVTSYSGEKFTEVDNAYVRVVDQDRNDEEIARYSLSDGQATTGLIIAHVTRKGSGWALTAVGEYAQGRIAKDLASAARAIA